MSEDFTDKELALMAGAWDAALSSMQYDDGSKVEIVYTSNPFLEALEDR